MDTISAPGEKESIINRREIEPLLEKARQILRFYKDAMSCQAIVLDKEGIIIDSPQFALQMKRCESCLKAEKRNAKKGSCEWKKLHHDAQAESRRAEQGYIYACRAGFVYWTSPLYHNGQYAGAMTAGQVSRKEKSHEEIETMARLLSVCAEEISEKTMNPGEIFRRSVLQGPGKKKPRAGAEKPENCGADYPLEKERMLLAAFRRGDIETGGRILTELINNMQPSAAGDFEAVRFRAIELVVLLSRAAMAPDESGSDSLLETNDRYLRRIQDSKSSEELAENLRHVAERMAGKIFSFKGIRHASVLRKAERYIWDNYTRKISLEEISAASGLSAPYFSTIFKEEMGENLSGYLNRLRVDKAAALLTETGKSLNEIAASCGFDDQSWFSKIFKRYTGVSPGKYRETGEYRTGDHP